MALSYSQVFFVFAFSLICLKGILMEPSCSSFEFEKKMLENTIRLEYEYKLSNKKVNDELISLAAEKEKFMKEIKEVHERQIAEDEKSKSEISKKMKSMDAIFENQQATIQRLSHDLHEKTNETMKELNDKSRSADISFRASSSTNIPVSAGTTIIFPNIPLNHGNGYDPSTGHFTAPVNGTYMFSVRVCTQNVKTLVINIVVDGDLYSWGQYYDASQYICYTLNDIIDLVKGMEVWINFGSGSASSYNLYHDSYRYQNVFSGFVL